MTMIFQSYHYDNHNAFQWDSPLLSIIGFANLTLFVMTNGLYYDCNTWVQKKCPRPKTKTTVMLLNEYGSFAAPLKRK